MVNFGEVRKVQLDKSTLLTSTLESLGSFKVCLGAKESRVWKATGSYRTYSSLVKLQPGSEFAVKDLPLGRTATVVPESVVKDLPLGRTATLVPEFAVNDLPLGRTLR